jgi:hypothetical protein
MVFVTALLAVVMTFLTVLYVRFMETHARITAALASLEISSRFLEDVRADLRRARRVEVERARLRLGVPDGNVAYEFVAEGTVLRTAGGATLEYPSAFEEVVFGDGPAGTVTVTLELRRQDPRSPYRARMQAVVYGPNRKQP